jgi:preprotein translocase subunit SecY
VGAIYLILVQMVPTFLISGIRFDKIWLVGRFFENLPTWAIHGMNVNFYFGGTSLLIVVGVAMDTVQQVEAQLVMRNYDGFLRKNRVRGRRA